jgi:hypothetical protein
MIRRGFWLLTGFGIGVAAATKARRQLETATTRLAPSGVADQLRRDITGALEAGRDEMRDRETRLRHVLAAPDPINRRGNEDPGQ